jgi:hypothetical protein
MHRWFSPRGAAVYLAGLVALLGLQPIFAASERSSQTDSTDQTKTPARMNCGAQIECTTPDGRAAQVARVPSQDTSAAALIMDDDTVTCLLQEGETNFVVELPRAALLDRLTFLNENATARGELRIAVSNQRLAANSPEWREVEGIVPFAHKRLFGVSLLGIEARFVRLSFHVEKEGRIAALAVYGEKSREASADRAVIAAKISDMFRASGLDAALNSTFANLHAPERTLLLTANSESVGPLSQIARE